MQSSNAQHCLMAMIEKLRKFLNIRGHAGAFLTDLSKAFDYAYGFDTDAQNLFTLTLREENRGLR